MFYPNKIFNKIEDIDIKFLKDLGIKGVILDVDNTLIDNSKILSEDKYNWVMSLKENGINACILSNTIIKDKVEEVANKLDIKYFMFAKKPLSGGFKRCKKYLNLNSSEICVIGDQIFTDILGGNITKMYTIYVHPISPKDCSITTTIKRPLEKMVVKSYLKRMEDNK